MGEEPKERRGRDTGLLARAHSPHRLEALTDGVFAIAMTVLVLELRIPAGEDPKVVVGLMREQWPILAAYVVSFVLLGVYWYGQRTQYDYIRRVDRQLTWLNIFFLLGICTVPFAAALMGEYPELEQAAHFYGAVLIFCSSFHAGIWWYATNPTRGLVDPEEATPEVVALGKRLSLVPVIFYVIAMLLSYVAFHLSILVFALVPFLYVFDVVRKIRPPGAEEAPAGGDLPE